ncbi:hypothetical protein STCU_03215 [Strigomonas culicis]|uniref:BolA-like protein n=1 Tax=Strigomonas culicis TaxID=28005 RepID=S9W764_9TRYP|nr:hypothetical protein STCU_03215 [Strigomonas culicis]|eukprot:EPY31810.1 hypothetical protein STCU_03215 [Strigomonas culicis]
MFRHTLRYLAALSAEDIQAKLTACATLKPTRVAVEDTSQGCGSFFNITIVSPVFAGKPLIQQHRLVNDVLQEEIKAIHGFTLNTMVAEPEAKGKK